MSKSDKKNMDARRFVDSIKLTEDDRQALAHACNQLQSLDGDVDSGSLLKSMPMSMVDAFARKFFALVIQCRAKSGEGFDAIFDKTPSELLVHTRPSLEGLSRMFLEDLSRMFMNDEEFNL